MARTANRIPTLIGFPPELRERLDRYAEQWHRGNRTAAVTAAVELLLAQHAAYVQRDRAAAAAPRSGPSAPRPVHTSDRAPVRPREPSTAPITSALMDL